MEYRILFPCETYNIKNVDDCYLAEKNACEAFGIKYFYYDYDIFVSDNKLISNIDFSFNGILIYRGWMLKPEQYGKLYDIIINKSNNNLKIINNILEYSTCHCFPYIYDVVKKYTPRIIIPEIKIDKSIDIYSINNVYNILSNHIDFDFFLKDYVKSIKNENGIEKISKNIQLKDFKLKINDFIEERRKLFTGGVVFKEFVELKKYDNNKTNEWRVFYYKNIPIFIVQNSYLKTDDKPSNFLITEIGNLIDIKSNFYSVDFALKNDDEWIIIETGDGQVSGLPEGSEFYFYNNFINVLNNIT
jgi:hypothetical protein